jgi:YHS domain-containing protein
MMKKLLSVLAASLFATQLFAAGVQVSVDSNDVILNGYDAVAYFTEGKPVKGTQEYTAVYDGAVYRFASKANRNRFQANPAAYAPAYGGFCAYGASLGKKFAVNGKAFEVVNGRLYVNKDEGVYKVWKKDIPGNVLKAEGHWITIEDVAAGDL